MNGDRVLGANGKLDADAHVSRAKGVGIRSRTKDHRRGPYAGFTREKITYDGSTKSGSPSATLVESGRPPSTSRTRTPRRTTYAGQCLHQHLSDRYPEGAHPHRTTTYDDYGMADTVEDSGDTARSGDENCTRNWYARNDDRASTPCLPYPGRRQDLLGRRDRAGPADVRREVRATCCPTPRPSTTTPRRPHGAPPRPRPWGVATWKGRASAYPAAATNGERPPTGWQTVSKSAYAPTASSAVRISVTDDTGNSTGAAYTPGQGRPADRTVDHQRQGPKSYTYLRSGSRLQDQGLRRQHEADRE